ncbi:MAG: hypothetical protein VX083_09775 [Pseudomonadota bacterium]|jgi:hypothetical protein|uniref:Uncharacterized protein n=1 Tax=Thalassovita autumnalis TaxID=2072972 RepID=A0A0P1FQW4_9RHOB|nr:hypothetical protein [Thalassovita autumnalis]MEC7965991.1 hypothetical protein [Pseudomonadota bacterium]MEC8293774.1 hypothetical protein [Pseudomonadota bacterium]CUH67037.1 hypothetical protein TL5118_02005 [Thalassovita autumnalis]CUH71101.1 hypothetical protein TL5120_00881 [Thalassovita autumnalis]|tara:strand:+ start:448 stop:825 length:378 start_codon:yes stop_codon:yes gene_type:complete
MSEMQLTKTRLLEGVWEGVLQTHRGARYQPKISVTHLDKPVLGHSMQEGSTEGEWLVRVPIPSQLLSDGVQTFVILDAESGETLSSFAILAGDALADDIRAEVQLLREELDMLKRAFRRHCLETL